MANNRLVLLLAVALVAIIDPIFGAIESEESSTDAKNYLSAEDRARLEKLDKILPDEEIKEILSNFENKDFVLFGDISVGGVLAMLDLSVELCIDRIVSEPASVFAKAENRNLALNLYKFTIKPWIPYCAENVKKAFDFILSEDKFKKSFYGLAGASGFLTMLENMSDEPLSENYSSLIKGQYEELHNSAVTGSRFYEDLLPGVSSDKAKSEENLSEDDKNRVEKLSEKILPDKFIQMILRSFEDQSFAFCGHTKVERIWKSASSNKPDNCVWKISKVESSEFAGVANPILARNLYKFTVRGLMPYCAQNIEHVLEYIITESYWKGTCESLIRGNNLLEGLEYFTGKSFSGKFSKIVQRVDQELYNRCSQWDYCVKRAPYVFSNEANTEEEKASKIGLGADTKQVSLTDTEAGEDSGMTEHDEMNGHILSTTRNLPLPVISRIMNSFENDGFVFFGDVNVRDMFDLTILHQKTLDNCEDRFYFDQSSVFAEVENTILARNLYIFTLRDLMPYCAENFEDVIKSIVGKNPDEEAKEKVHEANCFSLAKAYKFSADMQIVTTTDFKAYFSMLVKQNYWILYKHCLTDRYYKKRLPAID